MRFVLAWVYASVRIVRVLVIVAGFAVSFGFGALTRRGARVPGPVRLRIVLERLGGAWVKLGQMLALRYDILPAAYCDELFALLNSLSPVSYRRVRKVVAGDLGQPPEVLFRDFERTPFAAASVGQVHRAITHEGQSVAVKVQRPGVRRAILGDILLMRAIAPLVDVSPLPVWGLRPIVAEFVRWTNEELDFRNEARHAQRLRALGGDDPTQYIPAVSRKLSSRRVFTAEMIVGTDLSAVAADHALVSTMDRYAVAQRFLWSMLNQIYGDGFFHADPHPANVLALADNRVAFLDFGIVGQLDDRTRRSVNAFGESILLGDFGRAASEFAAWLSPDDEAVKAIPEFIEVLEGYTATDDLVTPSSGVQPLSFELRLMDVVRRRELTIDPQLVRYTKAVVTARGTVTRIAPDFDVRPYERSFFLRKRQMTLQESLEPSRLLQWAIGTAQRVDRSLDVLQQLGTATTQAEAEAARVSRQLQALAIPLLLGAVTFLVFVFANPSVIRHSRTAVIIGAIAVGLLAAVILARARRLPKVVHSRRR